MIDLFVTGTDAGVGKTRVAGHLIQRFAAKGKQAGYLRPVQTGSDDDARTIAALAPGTVCATVYRYVAPLSPAVAARLQHSTPPSIEHIVEAVEELRAATEGVVIEGSGGLLEPLNETQTVADLAAAVGLPLLVVTRPAPEALNRVALTIEVARRRGILVAGIAVNFCTHRPDLGERTTRAELARLAPVLESLPREADPAVV